MSDGRVVHVVTEVSRGSGRWSDRCDLAADYDREGRVVGVRSVGRSEDNLDIVGSKGCSIRGSQS